MAKLYSKSFEYKGQMINYYNKVCKNVKIDMCWCGLFMDKGYMVYWTYKQ